MMAQTQNISNSFIPSKVSCQVLDSNGQFSIKNTGNVKAYIRAMVVVNWMDGNGNVYGTPPVKGDNADYTLVTSASWNEVDGIYYYANSVDSQASVDFITVTGMGSTNGDYTLTVEVVAEAIQAEGMGASSAQNAWAAALAQPNH